MAESPSSTSEKPPIDELGLGFSPNDAPPSDPIEPPPAIVFVEIHHSEPPAPLMAEVEVETVGEASAAAAAAADDDDAEDEETEFRNAIEKELYELTIQQAEIERAFEILQSADVGKGDYFGKESESVDDENENEIEVDGDAGMKSDGVAKLGRFNNQNNRGKRVNYPMRPDAEDCAYYMKFGSCKFGLNCKFNHPPKRKNQVYLRSWEDHSICSHRCFQSFQ